jgi:hypothetical protein
LFGTDSVFLDHDDIQPGSDFARTIEDQIAACDVLLVLIGKEWATSQVDGRRRLDDPSDYVRLEISMALARKMRVIPLLLNNAPMPAESELPDGIQNLSRHQAIPLSEARWDYDMGQLEHALTGGRRRWKIQRNVIVAVVAILLAVVAARWWFGTNEPQTLTGQWTANVEYDFGTSRPETFKLEQWGDQIQGTVSFLGVDRAIVDGKIDRDTISIVTSTTELSGDETRQITHRYDGLIGEQEIRFTMQTAGSISYHPPIKFTARRAVNP